MDRKEFDNLTIDKQIELINNRLNEYKTLTKVCNFEGLRRNTIRDRFQSHGYKLIDGQFIKIIDNEEVYSDMAATIKEKSKDNISSKPMPSNENTLEMIKAIQKELDKLKKEVKDLKGIAPVNDGDLNITPFIGSYENKSFRVNLKVYKEFKSFCNKHKKYKKQDLLSKALQEFMEKYK